jgi:signal transduction histidine kinase
MLDQIEDAFTEQKRLDFNLSHELRTPLAAIITELELCPAKRMIDTSYPKVISKTLQRCSRDTKLS